MSYELFQHIRLAQISNAIVPATSDVEYVGGDSGEANVGTSIALTAPVTIQADDFAIIWAFGDNETATASSAGFTAMNASQNLPLARAMLGVAMYKRLDGTETTITVSFSASEQYGAILGVYRNVHLTTPFDIASPYYLSQIDANTFVQDPADITTITDDAAIVLCSGLTHDDIDGWVAPGGYALGATPTIGLHRNVGMAHLLNAGVAGAKVVPAWQNTGSGASSDSVTFTIALRKAA